MAAAGLAASLYFTLVYYAYVAPRGIPRAFCQKEEQTCITILRTPYARLFGLPNSVLGLGFYLLVGGVAVQGLWGRPAGWLQLVALAAAMVTVAATPYLLWALLVRLKTWCSV